MRAPGAVHVLTSAHRRRHVWRSAEARDAHPLRQARSASVQVLVHFAAAATRYGLLTVRPSTPRMTSTMRERRNVMKTARELSPTPCSGQHRAGKNPTRGGQFVLSSARRDHRLVLRRSSGARTGSDRVLRLVDYPRT